MTQKATQPSKQPQVLIRELPRHNICGDPAACVNNSWKPEPVALHPNLTTKKKKEKILKPNNPKLRANCGPIPGTPKTNKNITASIDRPSRSGKKKASEEKKNVVQHCVHLLRTRSAEQTPLYPSKKKS
ncbi:hypothetical protein VTH06DRAFT_3038 [Thermothelomyces fergusii]